MKAIKQIYHIKAPISRVWKALTDPKEIDRWGGGPAKMNSIVGAEFSLWGGSVFGKNIEVIPEKKLVQEWYSENKWDKPSIAKFTLEKEKTGAKVELIHTDMPIEEYNNLDEGWKIYYLGPMKEFLEK